MKIKKELIPLILSGEKKYEFRNSSDKDGVYDIEGKKYKLIGIDSSIDKGDLYFEFSNKVNMYSLNGRRLTKEEYMGLTENQNYFIVKDEDKIDHIRVYIYLGEKINDNFKIYNLVGV